MAVFVRVTLALVAVALAGAAWLATNDGTFADPAAELARLVPGHRPLLARVSLPLAYAPFDPAAPPADPKEREAIYARLLGEKDAGAVRATPAFYVTRGEPGDAERALAEAADPVDRGAVLLALDRPDEALEEFAKALAARPGDPAALFDRALALEALLLDGQAAAAWEAFLAAEGTGGWADEARSRLAALRAPAAARERSLEERKRDALEALYEPHPALDAVRDVALALADAGDRLLLHEVDYLESLDTDGWRRREDAARRFAELRAAVWAGQNRDEALAALGKGEDPLVAAKALHFAAYGAIVRDDRVAGERWLLALRDRCRTLGCAEELALVESDLGTIKQREGRYAEALAAFERAGRLLPAVYETRRSELDTRRADLEARGGAYERAARLFGGAVETQRRLEGKNLAVTLRHRGSALEALGRLEAALACDAEAERVARRAGNVEDECAAIDDEAALLGRLGRHAEGVALLEGTLERLRHTDLAAARVFILVELARLLEGEGELPRARQAAEEALTIVRPMRHPRLAAAALEARARVARRDGDVGMAIAALREAVDLDEGRAAQAPGPLAPLGIRSATASRRMLLALLLGEAGDTDGAFAIHAGGTPSGLPSDECRLGVGHLDDRSYVVAFTSSGADFVARPQSDAEWTTALTRTPAASDGLEPLLDAVPCLATSRRISILDVPGVPAAPLAAAVRRRHTGRLIGITSRPDARWPEPRQLARALVIHDPAVGGDDPPPPLPNAAREAEVVAAAVPGTVGLSGPAATPAEVRLRAPAADLLHFAVHGVAKLGLGAASHLVLAGDPGRLEVADVLALELGARRPLVILSACKVGGRPGRLEHDGAGLPWAFLQAGASAVLATDGDLDDGAAVAFSRSFLARLATGLPVAEAAAAAEREAGPSGPGFLLYF